MYGSRATPVDSNPPGGAHNGTIKILYDSKPENTGIFLRFLDLLATLQVRHGFFLHFYVVSVLSSVFWAFQLLSKGFAFQLVSGHVRSTNASSSMTVDQVALTWGLMTVQGIRRLYESSTLGESSTSKMWFTYWLLGMTFYLAFGVALWIEGTPAILVSESVYSSITISAPSIKTMVGIPIFILASGIQHDCHTYLASLPKYTLPMHPIFQVMVCPHYLAECLIYLSLAIIGAPKGTVMNKTILSALLFVVTNLAVTASTTKDWYERKFGKTSIAGRWIMVPGLY